LSDALCRRTWIVQQARAALVLLALWPVALLFPTAALAVLTLGIDLSLINQTSAGPYFEQTLFMWE